MLEIFDVPRFGWTPSDPEPAGRPRSRSPQATASPGLEAAMQVRGMLAAFDAAVLDRRSQSAEFRDTLAAIVYEPVQMLDILLASTEAVLNRGT